MSEVGRPGSVAATGLAAYKLSPHGQGEELFAELAGTIPLGEKLGDPKSLGELTDKLDNSVLFAKPRAELIYLLTSFSRVFQLKPASLLTGR